MSEVGSIEPTGIFAEMDAQPPLMRQQAAAAYLGKEVCWSLIFSNATQHGGQARLIFRFDPQSVRMVVGGVLLSSYPSLMRAHAGENALVRGRIRKIDDLSIELEIQELILAHSTEVAR